MISRTVVVLCIALLLTACASHEGVYEPACLAYEGDTIELHDGRFVWRRFTDQRIVDENGEIVDPFPNFPKAGSYRLSGGRVTFLADRGDEIGERYLQRQGDDLYLLTTEENEFVVNHDKMPSCALRLANPGS